MSPAGQGSVVLWRESVLVLIGLSALAAAFTWPLVAHLGWMPGEFHDAYGHVWGLAWVVKQLAENPLRIYESNMYWPHTLSLAYTEVLLPQSLMAAPFLWLGLEPVVVHNLMVFVTFPMSGFFTYLLARSIGAGRSGAMVAALGYSFCSFRWDHFIHLGVLSTQWLPLVLLLLARSLKDPSGWNLAGLGLAFVCQALSSGYYAVLIAICVGVALLMHVIQRRSVRGMRRVVACLLVATAACWVVGIPYRIIRARLAGPRAGSPAWSATALSYVDPGPAGRFYPAALDSLRVTSEPLSPGFVVLTLGLLGAVSTLRRREHLWIVAIGVVTFALSLGPELQDLPMNPPGPYALLQKVPPVDMMRAPARLGIAAVMALSLLAAVGCSRLVAHTSSLVGWLVVATVAMEMAPRPLNLRPPMPVPQSADWLAHVARGPVLELPWDDEASGGRSLYWSTRNWQPMVNGHGTFPPQGNLGASYVGSMFPGPYASRTLRCSGIRYLVVHTAMLPEHAQIAMNSRLQDLPPGSRLAWRSTDWFKTLIFELEPATAAECQRHHQRFPDSILFPDLP